MSDRDRFDKFTERARKVLSLAQEEAQRFQHPYIGTEHLLLALVGEGEGVAAKVLVNLGVELNRVRSAVEFIIGRGDRIVLGEMGLTPRSKKVIELAVDEARQLKHHYIGTEHLLLGLVREGEGVAAGVLNSLGIELEDVRRETLRLLGADTTTTVTRQAEEEDVTETVIVDDENSIETSDEDDANTIVDQDEEDSITEAGSSENDKLDKFTVRARKVLHYAQEEAQRFQHNYIGTEHLLLGLVHEDKGVAATVLRRLGIRRAKVRSGVEFIIGQGDRIVSGEVGLTPRAKKVLELAIDEARRLNSPYISSGHLLLGLVREGEGIGAGILESMGVSIEKVRRETVNALEEAGE